MVKQVSLGAVCAFALVAAFVVLGGEVRAEPDERDDCGIFFNEDSCPAEIPRDEAARTRVRAFCGGLKEAADAVLSGARPGFRIQRGEDWWQGDVSEHRVMWGNIRGRGIYTYDANAENARQRYELAFFFPGVSAAELNEGLNICPAFFLSVVRGTPATPIVFMRGRGEGQIEMLASPEARQYNRETRAHESGAMISFVRQ